MSANEDVEFAAWERIGEEEREDAPAMVFIVTDDDGNVIRQLEGPVGAGFHRVAWDLRYPAHDPWVPESERSEYANPTGVLAAPGTYTVAMYQRIDGELTDLGQQQDFEVVSIRQPTLAGASQTERIAFSRQVDDMLRAARGTLNTLDETLEALEAIRGALSLECAA